MKNVSKLLLMSMLTFMTFNALAFNQSDSIQVSVSGNIIASSCNIQVKDTVSLGDYTRADLSVPGANSGLIPVDIILTQCSAGMTSATVTFTGSAYKDDPAFAGAIYANDLAEGTKDIGLQLFNLDGKPLVNLANGVSYTFPVEAGTGSGKFKFASRLYSPHGTPTAGEFKATVTLNFSYQ